MAMLRIVASDERDQGSLFIEVAKLSESFFTALKRHPVPIEEAAIKAINNNSQAIDVYIWLAYRLHSLSRPMTVTWKALHGQFGNGYSRLDHFRRKFSESLHLAAAVYPDGFDGDGGVFVFVDVFGGFVDGVVEAGEDGVAG